MKNDISSIELKYIIDEMQTLIGARLDRITQKEREISLQFYATGKGNFTLKIVPGKFFYLTSQKASGAEQHNFMMRLRKYLPIATLAGISQAGSERIVEITLENKEGRYRMYSELYGRGNVILCGQDRKVIAVLDRQLIEEQQKEGKELMYEPPKKGLNLSKAQEGDFEMLEHSKQNTLVKALAIDLNIGGVYSEELCLNSKLDKNKMPKDLSKEEIHSIFKSFHGIVGREESPRIIYKSGQVLNVVPFEMEIYKGLESKEFRTFNEAIDSFLSSSSDRQRTEEIKVEKSRDMVKAQKIIDEQGKSLAHAEKEMKENREKGEKIYENYGMIKEILDEVNKARIKYSWAEIKERLKGHKVIKSVNEKDKKVVIEI